MGVCSTVTYGCRCTWYCSRFFFRRGFKVTKFCFLPCCPQNSLWFLLEGKAKISSKISPLLFRGSRARSRDPSTSIEGERGGWGRGHPAPPFTTRNPTEAVPFGLQSSGHSAGRVWAPLVLCEFVLCIFCKTELSGLFLRLVIMVEN